MSIDMGQYDAMKSQPRSEEETNRIFAEYKARVNKMRDEVDAQRWLDVANKLPTYEEVKEHVNPALKSIALEWVNEWKKGEVR